MFDLSTQELLPKCLGVRASDGSADISEEGGGLSSREASAGFHGHRHLSADRRENRFVGSWGLLVLSSSLLLLMAANMRL
mgnify:CR=1 FL=1